VREPPQERERGEHDRVQEEEHGVQPVLARRAQPRVDPLVLGHDQARRDRERAVDRGRVRGRRARREPRVADRDRQRVDRVAEPLPARQAAPAMEVAVVDRHRRGLQHGRDQEDGGDHVFSSTAPHIVSPGPNAKVTTRAPRGTAGSSASRIHTCGRVADDMLP
jgi:hypothetical protein